ncbi:MAG: elongation factor P [Candidatus Moranbacteria bacterium]|nr:elongation factor P [Candidatus Moranbacteria bacterium]
MLSISDIKKGKKIVLNGEPFLVLADQHSKTGRAGAVLRTKLKNLRDGSIINKTFQGSERAGEASIETKKAQFLYREADTYYFMNNETYEQFELPQEVVGEQSGYLKEGAEIDVYYFEGNPINIQLPIKMDFEVTEAPPGIKGNTADGGSKQVTLETGLQISTPLFVEKGDVVKVNTEKGEYVERA